ncbi:SRPBCC family protein [Kitasatospora paracochleata]|uniref:Uncharacterized protein YndB with AHSA1/START domain n=1 Tax=Kitasatospora paracochleata TaxID=58354 RepID=A0ABT1J9J8_9ACTN|nr:SRPBCC domain-containing protein [Kitasatospora paracochleata]MCP2313711.1 uncharacterized protein YndB with AHSA1/START domain [Kitasatospora paracochleata]
MNAEVIERETLIEAPLERVWTLVAEPGFWVADEENLTGNPGQVGDSVIARSAKWGEFPVRVEKVQPPTYVAYRWASAFGGDTVSEDNSTLVEFTLIAEGDKTRLRVVESGFEALACSGERRTQAFESNTQGWPQVLDGVRSRIEASSV